MSEQLRLHPRLDRLYAQIGEDLAVIQRLAYPSDIMEDINGTIARRDEKLALELAFLAESANDTVHA